MAQPPGARFCPRCGTRFGEDTWPATGAGERRQLTVMFCDLVGSTELSGQLDPEELSEVIHGYHLACDQVVREVGGHVAQYLGDGVLVYFGYPLAQENAARRAVHAGLQILEELPDLSSLRPLPRPLQARIGIHTGLVVVGDPDGDELAVGGAPNAAAHVQAVAPPDSVVVSEATRRLLGEEFDVVAIGPRELKGLPSMALYRVLGEVEPHECAPNSGLGNLVGRRPELEQLAKGWQDAQSRAGRVILVSGEAGIGKSRLLRAAAEQVRGDLPAKIDCHCSPYHQNSTLYPLVGTVQRLLGFQRQDSPARRLEKLRQAVAHARSATPQTLGLLASMLSLPEPEGAPAMPTGQLKKQRTLEALVAWLLEMARRQPVLIAFEDLHWADPSSLELLDLLIGQAGSEPILVLISSREAEAFSRWKQHAHVSHLPLERLESSQTLRLIEGVGGGKPLPAKIAEEIARKTDGVPLFVEELTTMVLESGWLRETEAAWEVTAPLPDLEIPATLQDSLMARLDQLASARRVAQLAAILGREFSGELIQVVWDAEPSTLAEGLRRLVESGLLHRLGSRLKPRYLFKHALIRDVAYESLLRSTRQRFHGRIGRVLEERFPELSATEPETVAHHFTAAGQVDRALPYWKSAGERALGRSAYVEAVHHLSRGLELLAEAPATAGSELLELELRSLRGVALAATRGYASREVELDYSRAADLCRDLRDAPHLFPVLYGLWAYHSQRDERGATLELAQRLDGLAGSPEHEYAAIAAQGVTAYWSGEYAESDRLLRRATGLYQPGYHVLLDRNLGGEAPVLSRIYHPWCLLELGCFGQALAGLEALPALSEEFAHPYIEVTVLVFEMCGRMQFGQVEAVRALAERITALATEHQYLFYLAPATCGLGWARIREGARDEGLEGIRQGIGIFRATGAVTPCAFWLGQIADGLLGAGRVREGLATVEEALDCEQRLARFYLADLSRLKGELLCVEDPASPEAERCFRTALEVAARQGARSQQLRSATSLARWLHHQGRGPEGRELLTPLWEGFAEGRASPVAEAARECLDQLA